MHYTEIAPFAPFEGAPEIHLPARYGASPQKPILLRVPVTGERPVKVTAENLPEGLTLSDRILSGKLPRGEYEVTLTAENRLGSDTVRLKFEITEEHLLLYPLLGFTTWNAFGSAVCDGDIRRTASLMDSLGIAEYGYAYVNLDSGWQDDYGGEFDAIMPNEKFPDMKALADYVHGFGLKMGIYSTPMLDAWGCPAGKKRIPGCTVGDPDPNFGPQNRGIGLVHKEAGNARQWAAWGMDYLKYDWKPCDPINAERMRQELLKQDRDFGFCVTVHALPCYNDYWTTHVNSYRNNTDSKGTWDVLCLDIDSYLPNRSATVAGHYFDLDMLEIGSGAILKGHLTEDEAIYAFGYRALVSSPLQISSPLDKTDAFTLSVLCNGEVLAVNQDFCRTSAYPVLLIDRGEEKIQVLCRPLSDGSYAYGFFNAGEVASDATVYFDGESSVRDLWAKKDLPHGSDLTVHLEPHTSRLFRVKRMIPA